MLYGVGMVLLHGLVAVQCGVLECAPSEVLHCGAEREAVEWVSVKWEAIAKVTGWCEVDMAAAA